MLEKGDKIALSVIGILTLLMFVFWTDIRKVVKPRKEEKTKIETSADEQAKIDYAKGNAEVHVVENWSMPAELHEISGIAYLEGNRFACVQDEMGKIFIYNAEQEKIEKTIEFGGAGDYEGIAVTGNTAWVLRADGKILEIKDFMGSKPEMTQHNTSLTAKQDAEGLHYDAKNNRLLLAIKGYEVNTKDFKGIYAFDLSNKKFNQTPVFKITLNDDVLKEVKKKQKIEPSDLSIHPTTGDLYILEGAEPKLLIMGQDGKKKKLVWLKNKEFIQPEGIDFSPEGELFISNEGQKKKGNILKVNLNI